MRVHILGTGTRTPLPERFGSAIRRSGDRNLMSTAVQPRPISRWDQSIGEEELPRVYGQNSPQRSPRG
jgi:hypothetical protein